MAQWRERWSLTRRIGIMGGTFDPIHYGHLIGAEEARFRFGLEKVIFMPCGQPPHKKDYPVTPARHRLAMVLLATASNPYFQVSTEEIERPGPSYTIDTIRSYRERFGEALDLYFITGADAILEILTWKENTELIRLTRFIGITRPGYDLTALNQRLPPSYLERIDILEIPTIDISSTQLRQRVCTGEPIRYLTPDPVRDYIAKEGLYRNANQKTEVGR